MALSNSYSFTVSATDIINEAMLNCGAIGEGETPTAQEYSDCLRKLNMMVKQWCGKQDFAPGLKMWTRQRGDLFLSSSQGVYQLGPTGDNWAGGVATSANSTVLSNFNTNQLTATAASGTSTLTVGTGQIANFTLGDFLVVELDSGDIFSSSVGSINAGAGTLTLGNSQVMPSQASSNAYVWNYSQKAQRPLAIETVVLRDSANNDIPLNRMTLEDYELLPTKTSPQYLQDPTAFYYESQIGSGLLTPVNTGGGNLYLDCGGAQDVTKHLHIVYLRAVMDLVNYSDNPEYPQQWYRALCWGLTREICPMFDAEYTEDIKENLLESLGMARQGDPETTTLYFEANAEYVP